MQSDRHFWEHFMDVPELQSESWGVTGIHKFPPLCGTWKAARRFSLGERAAVRRPVVQTLRVLSCWCYREGDAVVQAGNGTAQLGESSGKICFGFLVSCVTVMAIVMCSEHRCILLGEKRRDVLCLLSGLAVNVVWGSVGKGKNTESMQMWLDFFFYTLFT